MNFRGRRREFREFSEFREFKEDGECRKSRIVPNFLKLPKLLNLPNPLSAISRLFLILSSKKSRNCLVEWEIILIFARSKE